MGNALCRYLRLVVGDDTGAETEVTVPWRLEYLRLKVGEPAELLVLSTRMVGESGYFAPREMRAAMS